MNNKSLTATPISKRQEERAGFDSKNPAGKDGYGNSASASIASRKTGSVGKRNTTSGNSIAGLSNNNIMTKQQDNDSTALHQSQHWETLLKERDHAVQTNHRLEHKLERVHKQLSIRERFDREEVDILKQEIARLQKERDAANARSVELEQALLVHEIGQQEAQQQPAACTTTASCSALKHQPLSSLQKELDLLQSECDKVVAENKELKRQVTVLASHCEKYERRQKRQMEQLELLLDAYNDCEDYEQESSSSALGTSSVLGPINFNLVESTERIGDYDVGEFLGCGEFAQVRKGIHRETRNEYAIKCIKKENLPLVQLENEVTILTQLNHANILQAADVYHARHAVYLMLELGYMDLRNYVANNNNTRAAGKSIMNEDDLRQVMIGTLEAIEYLHSFGICHSDIKQENILIMSDNSAPMHSSHIRLCDFGMCSVQDVTETEDLTHPVYQYSTKGTTPFMAPEALTAAKTGRYDARPTDMWAIGCMLLELTHGLPQEWEETYKLHETDAVGFEKGIQACLSRLYKHKRELADSVVHALLQQKPGDRPTATQVLAHEWFKKCLQESKHRDVEKVSDYS